MANENDPIADLGLDEALGADTATGTVDTADAAAASVNPPEAAETGEPGKVKRQHVNVGELEFGSMDILPEIKRGGGGGGKRESKYKFDELAAPVAKEDGSGFTYAFFTAKVQDGVDPEALRRSVQSATTAENKTQKDAGSKTRFITRSAIKDGELVGYHVIRVDDTVKAEADEA